MVICLLRAPTTNLGLTWPGPAWWWTAWGPHVPVTSIHQGPFHKPWSIETAFKLVNCYNYVYMRERGGNQFWFDGGVHLQSSLYVHPCLQSSNSKHLLALLPEEKDQKQSESTLGFLFGPFASLAFLGARTCGPRGLACFALRGFRMARKIFSDLADWGHV
jgi:hypothetical protein